MTNKMAARGLSYELELLKARKVENNDKKDRLLFFKPGLWQMGFWMWQRMAPFSAGTNGE